MSETTHEILLDLGPCHGCSGCHEMCPEIFGWDDDNDRPYLKRPDATEEEIREALSLCPKECIQLADD